VAYYLKTAGIGRRGCAGQSGLQLPCLSNSVGRSTAELTDVIHNAQPLTMYKSQGFYNWRSVSLCVFLPSPFIGSWPYIFLSCLLNGCLGASLLTRRWALSFIKFLMFVSKKVKVKWSRYRPGVAQRVGRGIALLFHDRGTWRGWVVSSTPQPHFTPGKDPVLILQEAGWVLGPVWMGGKSRPHRDSIPDLPAHSQSL